MRVLIEKLDDRTRRGIQFGDRTIEQEGGQNCGLVLYYLLLRGIVDCHL